MKVYYWSPHLSKVGTIKSVYNSCKSLRNQGIDAKIINTVGEWKHLEDEIRIDLFNKKNFYNILPRKGYFQSKFSNIIIFVISFVPLLRLLKKNEPNFLIIHLLTSLPLILKKFFSLKTAIILRISGKINFSPIRKLLWKSISNLITVTSPTVETRNHLIEKKIFLEKDIYLIKDPILEQFKKIESQTIKLNKRKNFLAVGRLTKQKNFIFLITVFAVLIKKYKDLTLTIFGEDAEEKEKLEQLIKKKNLENHVFLSGFREDMETLFKDYDCFVLSSLHEEPGFVLIEAASNFLPIISSDCPSGPREILGYGDNGFIFKSNNEKDFLDKLEEFLHISDEDLKNKLLNLNQNIKEYTLQNHSQKFVNLFKEKL